MSESEMWAASSCVFQKEIKGPVNIDTTLPADLKWTAPSDVTYLCAPIRI